MSRFYRQSVIEQSVFLRRRYFEFVRPLHKLLACYDRILQTPALNPVEKDIHRNREIMQLDGSAKLSGSKTQCVSLRSSPSAPFNNYREAESEEVLTELPLYGLDFFAHGFIPNIDAEGIHPFVGTETNRPEFGLKVLGIRCLSGAWQATHND